MTVFCSWSGGKESTLALSRFLQENTEVDYLLTVFPEKGSKLGHGVPDGFYRMQAESIGVEMISGRANWENYGERMSDLIRKIHPDIGIFGDVYLEEHREWVERKAGELNFEAVEPLWGGEPGELLKEYLNLGFEGIIVKVDPDKVSPDWLGEPVNRKFLDHLEGEKICPIGENGEYHTATLNGPVFDREILVQVGDRKEYGNSLIIEFEKFELI